jgi:subtilase family serine protease
MGLYHDPVQNRDFYAPDREPTVDLPFRLWHISGLDNYSIPRPELVRRPSGMKPPATTGSCPQQSFCGSDMRAAYYEGTALTGKGQNIGLLEFAGFDIADVNTYYKNAKQKRTAAVKGISTDGTKLLCLYSQGCDDTEQTLDMTQALGMAPGITTLYVYVGSSDTLLLGAMSSDKPLPLNLSSSWGWTPADPKTDDPYFKKMAAQGQSFFEAAGDNGAWKPGDSWPADSDYLTSVGGTDLKTKGPGEGWASESVWTPYGGGGISPNDIPIPSWQKLKGVITKANEGSTKYRNGPDVSANSNFTFYVCADQSPCTSNKLGGTSFAAPMWAGYLALANEQAASKNDKPPGFINPTIYPLGLGKYYHADFHDITDGYNGFPATKGYDLASGWGSPNKDGLINALAGSK